MINLEMDLSEEETAFRDEVRAFLKDKFTPELRQESARQIGVFAHADLTRRWQAILHERGWAAPHWPKKYGGADFTAMQQYIFSVELTKAGAPALPALGLNMCGPVIMRFGTQAQKDFFLPKILTTEHYWCQGYSEPEAGSDLASLRCRAVRHGDDYIINGQKIWTTHAHFANWIFMLVRTWTEGKPQEGISFLLVPMDTPGITVRPIYSMSGEHEVNEVFFDEVCVPVENLVGEENRGWDVAKFLLVNERGGGSPAAYLKGTMKKLLNLMASPSGQIISQKASFQRKRAEIELEIFAIECMELEILAEMKSGGAELDASLASILKLKASEILQKITELEVECIGQFALVRQRSDLNPELIYSGPREISIPVPHYLNMRAFSIFGGSSEVQKNILARTALAYQRTY